VCSFPDAAFSAADLPRQAVCPGETAPGRRKPRIGEMRAAASPASGGGMQGKGTAGLANPQVRGLLLGGRPSGPTPRGAPSSPMRPFRRQFFPDRRIVPAKPPPAATSPASGKRPAASPASGKAIRHKPRIGETARRKPRIGETARRKPRIGETTRREPLIGEATQTRGALLPCATRGWLL